MENKQHSTEKKTRAPLPMRVYLCYLLAAALIFTGITFSKYITATSGGDEARATTFGELSLTEEEKPESFVITPGVNIKKNPLVNFAMGKESKIDKSEPGAYVFVCVVAENWQFDQTTDQTTNQTTSTYRMMKDEKELMQWSVDANWKYLTTNNWYRVFYRYVPPNENLTNVPVISGGEIIVSPKLYASDYPVKTHDRPIPITFTAYAVQANGFGGAEHAWWELANTVHPTRTTGEEH